MNNQDRRKIVNQAKADGYQGSYVDLFKQAAQDPAMVANTPEQKQAGLRPFHEQGKTDASMAFPDTPPNTPFNTVGMKAPIDIKKFDEQGHLVKSYESVPPGIQNLDTGPNEGTVIETPARMQKGGGLDEAARLIREHNLKEDSTFENIVEMFDPTGISAWDDAYRAYTSMKARGASFPNMDEGLDMLGAIPVMGKAKAAVNLYKKSNKPIRYGLTEAYNKVFRHTGRAASIIDGIEDETGFLDRKEQNKPVQRQTGGYNPGEYMNEMQPKVFPNQKRDAQWVNYATEHDFAGRFPGETRTNEQIGLERSNRNTVPLPPTPTVPKELRVRAQEGATRQDSLDLYNNPAISFQKGGPKAEEGDPTEDKPVLDAFMMEKFMADKKGGDPETWRAVADTIGYHESGPWGRMDPKATQVPSGIGRGIFQFETTHSESFKTAKQRHRNVAKAMGVKPDPGILKANNADELSREQQYLLFYGNMYESPAKLSDYTSGNLPLVDLWLQSHKRKEAEGDRKAFESSRLDAKRNLRNYPSIGIAPNTTASVDATRTVSPQLQRAFDILKKDN